MYHFHVVKKKIPFLKLCFNLVFVLILLSKVKQSWLYKAEEGGVGRREGDGDKRIETPRVLSYCVVVCAWMDYVTRVMVGRLPFLSVSLSRSLGPAREKRARRTSCGAVIGAARRRERAAHTALFTTPYECLEGARASPERATCLALIPVDRHWVPPDLSKNHWSTEREPQAKLFLDNRFGHVRK